MTKLTPELLLEAYRQGIFPMAESRCDPTLFWFDPEHRAILPLDGFHVSRSLRRTVRQRRFALHADRAFEDVMRACAAPAPGREDSWINEKIIGLYTELHHSGHAHSVECWQDDRLVGGVYGIAIGTAFFGESMFSQVTDASKVALVHLAARLRYGGFTLFDAQYMSAHLRRFGAMEISRGAYRKRLGEALVGDADFHCLPVGYFDPISVLQSITQTS